MKLRMRWHPDDDRRPGMGDYMVPDGPRAHAAYLVLGVVDRGSRGGLGSPVHRLLILHVERCQRGEAVTSGRFHWFTWDKRTRRPPRHFEDFAP